MEQGVRGQVEQEKQVPRLLTETQSGPVKPSKERYSKTSLSPTTYSLGEWAREFEGEKCAEHVPRSKNHRQFQLMEQTKSTLAPCRSSSSTPKDHTSQLVEIEQPLGITMDMSNPLLLRGYGHAVHGDT